MHGFAHWRPERDRGREEFDADAGIGIGVHRSDQAIALCNAFGLNDDLSGRRGGRRAVQRQNKARRTFAHIGGPIVHALLIRQPRLERRNLAVGRIKADVLAHGHIHNHLRTVARGEELLFDELHPHDRNHENPDGRGQCHPFEPHRLNEDCAEGFAQTACLGFVVLQLFRQERYAQHGRKEHRDHPAQEERDRDHPEERVGKFTRARPVEADRDKARRGDQRARQHRKRDRGPRIRRGLAQAFAQFEPRNHGFNRDHRVIDQKAERNNQRAERNPLKRDAHRVQNDKSHGKNERDRQRHHQTRPNTERDKAHGEDDHNRLDQGFDKVTDGFLNNLGLVGDKINLDPDGQTGLHLCHEGL